MPAHRIAKTVAGTLVTLALTVAVVAPAVAQTHV